MFIANPMYDAVFKHLLEDPAVARLIIGTILDKRLESLRLEPQESAVQVRPLADQDPAARPGFTLQRVDLAATVETADGERVRVLVEVQRTRTRDELERFRRYVGQHYASLADANGTPPKLTTIYILGHKLPGPEATVLRVTRQFLDGVTGELLAPRQDFADSLTHDCHVIQVPRLSANRRNNLEKLLSVFDQNLRVPDNPHILELDETQMPARYAPVLRRLQLAALSPDVRELMTTEDSMLAEWLDAQREIAQLRETVAETERTVAETVRTIAESERTIAESERTIAESERTIAESERTIAESERTIAEQQETIRRQEAELAALRSPGN